MKASQSQPCGAEKEPLPPRSVLSGLTDANLGALLFDVAARAEQLNSALRRDGSVTAVGGGLKWEAVMREAAKRLLIAREHSSPPSSERSSPGGHK